MAERNDYGLQVSSSSSSTSSLSRPLLLVSRAHGRAGVTWSVVVVADEDDTTLGLAVRCWAGVCGGADSWIDYHRHLACSDVCACN